MLGKLIKYEYKATARIFLGLYLMVALLTIGSKIMIAIPDESLKQLLVLEILSGIMVATYVISLIAIAVITVVVIIKRFYDNMLKDEGYLTFTLPASIGQHIFSKVIVSYTWVLATVAVIALSIFGFAYNPDVNYAHKMSMLCSQISDAGLWSYATEVVFAMLLGAFQSIVLAYACMSIGQLYTKHRVIGAVIAYIAMYTINQIISTVFMVILIGSNGIFANIETIDEEAFLNIIMMFSICYSAVLSVVCIGITHYMLSKKLNLE